MKSYDVIVIGSGGGSKIGTPAAARGLKVAVIEKDNLGGTCLNRGCIPSKMLIHPADVAQEIREAHRFDIQNNPEFTVNFKKLVTRISNTIDNDSAGIVRAYTKNPNLDLYQGTAHFISNYVVEVNGQKLTAEKIFIAVGSRPAVPEISGLAETPFWTSTEALRNTNLPQRMIVIGASYIATELGHAYGALGCAVQFVVRSQFLRREDEDVASEFTRVFTEKYPVLLGYHPEHVSYHDGEFKVAVSHSDGQTQDLHADALLVATGVTSNADTLKLENTQIEVDANGYVQVDEHLQTSVPNVYALGDCIGKYFFRHSVNFEGEYLLRTVFTDPSDEPICYPPIPHAIFSNPQTASVGLTERECIDQNLNYVVGMNPYAKSAMGMALLSDYGFCKLIFDVVSRQLLGAHIVGPEASDMIHMPIAFLNMKATLDDMLRTIYIHPALPEIVRNAARKAKASLEIQSPPVVSKPVSAKLKW